MWAGEGVEKVNFFYLHTTPFLSFYPQFLSFNWLNMDECVVGDIGEGGTFVDVNFSGWCVCFWTFLRAHASLV